MRIFIGYDKNEPIAAYVLAHSLQRRASLPLAITFLNREALPAYKRERGKYDSTEFAISRFLVPWLCDYRGWALFMDCDMLCLSDIGELAQRMTEWHRHHKAIQVVKHNYDPKDSLKFMGQRQTKYDMKNWSSVMLFNNALCQGLTLEAVNTRPDLWLHQFLWTEPQAIGALPAEWNHLVGEYPYNPEAKLVHFTRGGPWFHGYRNCDYANEWSEELKHMLVVGEPLSMQEVA